MFIFRFGKIAPHHSQTMHLNIEDHRMIIQQIINFIIYATLKQKKSLHQRVVIHDVSINSMEIIILNYFSI